MNVEDIVIDQLKKSLKDLMIDRIITILRLPISGFTGKITYKLVSLFVVKVIFPLLSDLKNEGFLFLRKQELKIKLKHFQEATTDEEFNKAFDDLISGSKLR